MSSDQFTELLPQIYFIIQGAIVTIKYSLSGVFFGLILGIILALLKTSNNKSLRFFADAYTSVFRGTPLLIQLTIVYYGLPGLIGIKLSVFTAGVLAFSMNSGAYVSEIIRAGINSVDRGQFEAAKALGIPNVLMMKDIILPQAVKTILPSLINELINLIKESALISIIGEMDLMRRAQAVSAESLTFFIPMMIAAGSYYILVLLVSTIAKILEKQLNK